MTNYFTELSKVDCSRNIEKKGGFSYLSWPFAVQQLLNRHPDATWETKRFDGMPFMRTSCGYFVEVGVTVNGVERCQILPVLDNKNRPINEPNAFQINTSIQRCLVKAIALHGLGLHIYAGEDLPIVERDIQAELDAVNSKQGLQKWWASLSVGEKVQWTQAKNEKKELFENAEGEG